MMYDIHRLEPFYSPDPPVPEPPEPYAQFYMLYRNYTQDDAQQAEVVYEAQPTLPTLNYVQWVAPTGKQFIEWNTSYDGSGTSYSVGDNAASGGVYYAIWGNLDPIDYLTNNIELGSIADAIRSKGGTYAPLTYPDDFVDAINDIVLGVDVSRTTAIPSTVLYGYKFFKSNGVIAEGTIQTKSDSNISANGQIVTVPSGYYPVQYTKSVATGSATTPATTITSNPSISVNSSGLITATNSKTQSVTPTVSAGYVSSGTAGTITVSGSNTSQLTVQSAQTITPTTSNQTITSGKYLTGTQTILGDVNLIAENIRQNKTIFGITGTYTFPDANGVSF